MISSSLARSIALASLLVAPTTVAFTTSFHGAARPASMSLHSTAGEENYPNPNQRSYGYSPQEAQRNNDNSNSNSNIDLPHINYADSLAQQGSSTDAPNADNAAGLQTHEPRSSEFHNLEQLVPTSARRNRLESEARIGNIYTPSGSDSYWNLCDEIAQLEQDLKQSLDVGVSETAVSAIRSMLRRAQAKDPEHVYKVTSGAARSAERMGRVEESESYHMESMRARSMLPQFNLEGLWVGK